MAAKKAANAKKHVRLVAQVRADQVEALVDEARRRTPGQARADVSAVVRDAFDAWLAKPRKRS